MKALRLSGWSWVQNLGTPKLLKPATLIDDWVPHGCPWLGHVALSHSTDKCHLSTIDWSNFLPHVCPVSKPTQSPPATCLLMYLLVPHHLPHVIFRCFHVICTDCIVKLLFFACLGFRSECDIFRIRHPFDEVNIWPESGRRDGRNGVGFVEF
jgi:hypothetical protein